MSLTPPTPSMGNDDSSMEPSFGAGGSGDDAQGPPIETMGARYGIKVSQPGRGAHEPQVEPYLIPPTKYRNGGTERVADSIGLTPLGGLMPGPFAIPPAVPHGEIGTTFDVGSVTEATEFADGIRDSWPDGSPVPTR